jgi:hypothetical protein
VVAGLVAALGAGLGLERRSEEVARGESRVPARDFLPRLAVEEVAPRGLPLGVAEAEGLEGLAGMKVRSWNGEDEVMAGSEDEFVGGNCLGLDNNTL